MESDIVEDLNWEDYIPSDSGSYEVYPVENGNIVETYRVVSGEEEFFVQKYPGNGQLLEVGYTVLETLQDSEVPVPEPVAYDFDEKVLATRSVGNETLASSNSEELYFQAGKLLGSIHDAHSFGLYGMFGVKDGSLRLGNLDNWKEAFRIFHGASLKNFETLVEEENAAIDLEEVRSFYDRGLGYVPRNVEPV